MPPSHVRCDCSSCNGAQVPRSTRAAHLARSLKSSSMQALPTLKRKHPAPPVTPAPLKTTTSVVRPSSVPGGSIGTPAATSLHPDFEADWNAHGVAFLNNIMEDIHLDIPPSQLEGIMDTSGEGHFISAVMTYSMYSFQLLLHLGNTHHSGLLHHRVCQQRMHSNLPYLPRPPFPLSFPAYQDIHHSL